METLGQWGESLIASELKKRGWTVIERNLRMDFGELDIIAREPGGMLVFVEVKTMRETGGRLKPEDHLTAAKLAKLKKIAEFYANRNPQLVPRRGWRLDLAAVTILTDILEDYEMIFYENILAGESGPSLF